MTALARQPVAGLDASTVHALLAKSDDALPFDLADRVPQLLDVDVITTELLGPGYLMSVGSRSIIVVAQSGSWFRQNFSVAHELGHLACGSVGECGKEVENGHEAESNRFAADLLMPEAEIRSIDWSTVTLPVLAGRIWEWGVSTQAVRTRLHSLRITPRDDVADALSWATQRLLRRNLTQAPGGDLITMRMTRAAKRRFPTDLVSRLQAAVTSGRAPAESLAFALGVDVSQLDVEEPNLADPESDLRLLEGLE